MAVPILAAAGSAAGAALGNIKLRDVIAGGVGAAVGFGVGRLTAPKPEAPIARIYTPLGPTTDLTPVQKLAMALYLAKEAGCDIRGVLYMPLIDQTALIVAPSTSMMQDALDVLEDKWGIDVGW